MKQKESSPKEALYLTPSRAVLEKVIQRHVEWRFPGTTNQGRREASSWELIYFKREPMCNIVWAECLLNGRVSLSGDDSFERLSRDEHRTLNR